MPKNTRHPRPASPAKPKPKTRASARPKRRHLPAAERTQELLDAALELFADKGPSVTIQNLADRVKVTQPLVHRYFPTKADLLGAIRDALQQAHWDPAWKIILTDRSRPLADRICDFYDHYLPHIYRRTWYRGFWFFALGDPGFAEAYLLRVTKELLHLIIGEARHEFGYPSIAEMAPHPREIECVWGMHSKPIFQGVRHYVYEMDVPFDVATTVRDPVRAYLLFVPSLMREVFGEKNLAPSKVAAARQKDPHQAPPTKVKMAERRRR